MTSSSPQKTRSMNTTEFEDSPLVEVAVALPVEDTFHYRVPQNLSHTVEVGKRVLVPFGKRKVTGYVISEQTNLERDDVKEIIEVLDDIPLFSPSMVPFYQWISNYYYYPLGQVIKGGLTPGITVEEYKLVRLTELGSRDSGTPGDDSQMSSLLTYLRQQGEVTLPHLKKHFKGKDIYRTLSGLEKQGLVSFDVCLKGRNIRPRLYKDLFSEYISVEGSRPTLTKEQVLALKAIGKALDSNKFAPFLLHGITASGKTEIYLAAVDRVLSQGRQVIVLVPEIALTPQLEGVFKNRFGNCVAVLHSKLSLGVRYNQWMRIRKRETDVVIGTRLAIFAPLDQPGLIIVDEEHDTSYKQEKGLRYNARDLAVMRAKMAKAVLILGSATPSIQTYYNVMSHKFGYLPLSTRAGGGVLPEVSVVDMRKNKHRKIFSEELREAMGANLERKKQTLLFLNRRGFAGILLCTACGYVFRCLNCDVSLTYHLTEGTLRCHYCGLSLRSPALCQHCHGTEILYLGLGTERVEREIKQLYPSARVARMDRDIVVGRRSHIDILKGLQNGTIDILIGTQMITKGHHFPNITLVGVILADLSLNIPDFRASERTFQLLTQVAGRAGRGGDWAKVIIQTYNPDHYSILSSVNHDFFQFYKDEISKRAELSYPPFSRLINLKILGNNLQSIVEYSHKLGELCRSIQQKTKDFKGTIQILGPVAAPLSKIKGKYRWQLLIKGQKAGTLHDFCNKIFKEAKKMGSRGIKLIVDVDPMNML